MKSILYLIMSYLNMELIYLLYLIISKNLEFIITAFAKHIRKSDNIQLLIVGDGSETEHLKGLCRLLKISDMVFFAGAVSNTIMPDIYSMYLGKPAFSDRAFIYIGTPALAGVPKYSVYVQTIR